MKMYIDLSNVSEQDFARFQGLCFSRGIYWGISGIDAEAEISVFRKRHLATASTGLKLVKQML